MHSIMPKSARMTPMPMNVQLRLRAMRDGHVDSIGEEDGKRVVTLVPDEELKCSVWFNKTDMRPLRAELVTDGRVTVYVEISDWKEGAA